MLHIGRPAKIRVWFSAVSQDWLVSLTDDKGLLISTLGMYFNKPDAEDRAAMEAELRELPVEVR